MFVTLRCGKCDNVDCNLSRKYIPDESKEGCTREVDDMVSDQFFYYIEEVMPFVQFYKNQEQAFKKLNEIESFLNSSIYSAPLGVKLDSKGKAASSKAARGHTPKRTPTL